MVMTGGEPCRADTVKIADSMEQTAAIFAEVGANLRGVADRLSDAVGGLGMEANRDALAVIRGDADRYERAAAKSREVAVILRGES